MGLGGNGCHAYWEEAAPMLNHQAAHFHTVCTLQLNRIKLCKTLCSHIRELSHKALPLAASARVGLKLHRHIAWSGLECWRLVWYKCVNYVGVEVSFWVLFVWKCGKLKSSVAQKAGVIANRKRPHVTSSGVQTFVFSTVWLKNDSLCWNKLSLRFS